MIKKDQNQHSVGFTLFSRYPHAHVIAARSSSPLLLFPQALPGKEKVTNVVTDSTPVYFFTIKRHIRELKQVATVRCSMSIASFGAFRHR